MLTIFHINEHFYYVNKFHIWTFILMLTIFIFFHLWTFFNCEHIFHIWLISFLIILNVRTNFTFEQISYMIIFPSWTFFLNEQSFNYNIFSKCEIWWHIINLFIYEVSLAHYFLCYFFGEMYGQHFSLKNIFSKWTNFNYNIYRYSIFCKTIIINEHFYYVNKIHIWTFILFLTIFIYFSYITNFQFCEHIFHIWFIFKFDHFKFKNKFLISTSFIYEHFSLKNTFSKWTKFQLYFFLFFNFFVKQLLLMNNFIMWTSFIYEHFFLC
jgi:hypothetical protein